MRKGWLLIPLKFTKKAVRDILSTLYDDFDFKYMSAPRIWGWVACFCVVVAEFAELVFGIKFSGWSQLVTWAAACLGAYAAKKYSERGKPPPPSPYNSEDKEP